MKTKKIVITGVVLILVMIFIGTCDALLSEEDEIEYVDVVYSKNGREITVYLDGETVPITKSAKRAMSRDLAEMAYDYLEVVFTSGAHTTDTNIARASWELGDPAGISGITRDQDYSSIYTNGTGYAACLFAGKSSDKTLLGFGKIIRTSDGAGGTIATGTKSVTFGLAAVQTGLLVTGEVLTTNTRGVLVDSLTIATATSSLLPLGIGVVKTGYPLYTLPTNTVPAGVPAASTYTFGLSGTPSDITTYWTAVRTTGTAPKVQRREPRFVDGGTYRKPKGHTDTITRINLATAYTFAANAAFTNPVAFDVVVYPRSAGLLSFLIEVPVYNTTNAVAAKNSGPAAETWKLRTGYGSDLYNLDDGVSSGGCALIGIGPNADDFLNIDWVWLPEPATP
jgi:hypothetical protein